MPTFSRWLTEAGGGSADLPLSGFAQYGAAGLLLTVLLWLGWWMLRNEKARADANEAEIKRLNEIIQTKMVPALEAATVAVTESNKELARATARRRS